MPDNDLSTRGNAHIFCNYFPDYKKKKDWDSNLKSNINPTLLTDLSKLFDIEEEELINPITFYSYAILSSDFYLNEFKGKLFNVAGEWASIPITADKKLFLTVSETGERLAEIESRDFKIKTEKDDLETLKYYNWKIESGNIQLLNYDGDLEKIFLDIDESVLQFEVSGYNVVREWLKLHSYPYYRKQLEQEKITEFHALLSKIKLYKNTVAELDKLVEQILKGKLFSNK